MYSEDYWSVRHKHDSDGFLIDEEEEGCVVGTLANLDSEKTYYKDHILKHLKSKNKDNKEYVPPDPNSSGPAVPLLEAYTAVPKHPYVASSKANLELATSSREVVKRQPPVYESYRPKSKSLNAKIIRRLQVTEPYLSLFPDTLLLYYHSFGQKHILPLKNFGHTFYNRNQQESEFEIHHSLSVYLQRKINNTR